MKTYLRFTRRGWFWRWYEWFCIERPFPVFVGPYKTAAQAMKDAKAAGK